MTTNQGINLIEYFNIHLRFIKSAIESIVYFERIKIIEQKRK